METNLFREYRDEYSFETVQTVVGSLPRLLENHAPEIADSAMTRPTQSILDDVKWDCLDRRGPKMLGDETLLAFDYEHPDIRVRVIAEYATPGGAPVETGDLLGSQVKVVFRNAESPRVAWFTVHTDGRVEPESTTWQVGAEQ